jgi:tRNA 5-methylaminomethyl-2-thiouridine biosynthesis bifunctional protein
MPVLSHALFFPHARALDLGRLCDAVMSHDTVGHRPGSTCLAVSTDADQATVATARGASHYDHIVLCAGTGANGFAQARYLEVLPVWGQIDRIELSRAPQMALVGDGFMTPMHPGWGIGATYEHRPWDEARATEFNLQRFHAWWRELTGADPQLRCIEKLRGSRAVASDRMPVIGSLFDAAGETVPRLLVNSGHGSQGTVSAPFAAEWIASELCGEFAPCTRAELDTWGTMRFRLRQARRGPRHGGSA